jgi:hypothetical protein
VPDTRHPWTYHGQPATGGVVRPREPAGPTHPDVRGRLYVLGYGWIWLSGWSQPDGAVRFAGEPMSAGQVDQYCAPRPQVPARQAPLSELTSTLPGAGADQGTRAIAPAGAPAHPPGGARGSARGSHRVSEGPVPSHGEQTRLSLRRAKGGKPGTVVGPSSRPDAEATAAAHKELNDDIPF